MTTLTAAYPNGYSWTKTSSGYLDIASSASIGGSGLYVNAPGSITNHGGVVAGYNSTTGGGDTGATITTANPIANDGTIAGGAGGTVGGVGLYGAAGGVGGVGVAMSGGALVNAGEISGGRGADVNNTVENSYPVGVNTDIGGVGVSLASAGRLINRGVIAGGAGGAAYDFYPQPSFSHVTTVAASAGVGLALQASSGINYGTITGGNAIGIGRDGGLGGDGVMLSVSSLTNDGLIQGGGGGDGGAGIGVMLSTGSTLTNKGTIEGGGDAVSGIAMSGGYLLNSGTVQGGIGVVFADGTDSGTIGIGAYISGGSLMNTGTILGGSADGGIPEAFSSALEVTGRAGLGMAGSSYVTNDGMIVGDAGVSGIDSGAFGGPGVSLYNGDLVNNGAITGGAGGSGGLYGDGEGAAGSAGVAMTGGSLVNNGVIIGGAGGAGTFDGSTTVVGGVGGVGGIGATIYNELTVVNTGTISGGAGGAGGVGGVSGAQGNGVLLDPGAEVINSGAGGSKALIAGAVGVYGTGTVVNYGTVEGTSGVAVRLRTTEGEVIGEGGSTFIGAVQGGGGGLHLLRGASAGSLGGFSGFGAVTVAAGAVWDLAGANALDAGETLTNNGILTIAGTLDVAASALVESGTALYEGAAGAATVANLGTIEGAGGVSVLLNSPGDRLVAGVGSAFIGVVIGGGGTLELAGGTGTITGLGGAGSLTGADTMTFSGFGDYLIDAGGSWTLAGTDTLAASQTLTNLGTLFGDLTLGSTTDRVVAGPKSFTGVVVGGGGALELNGGTGTITGLGAAGSLAGADTMRFSGFGSYIIDPGGSWSLAGTSSLTAAQTLAIGGSLGNTGALVGAGLVTDTGILANEAAGVVDADLAGGLTVEAAGGTIANAGTLEASGSGLLLVEGGTIDNVGGTILADGRRVDLENVDIVGGALATQRAGAIAVTRGETVLDGTGAHAVSVSGTFVVEDATSLSVEGAIVNAGKIFIEGAADGTALVIDAGGATLTGGGDILLGDSAESHIYPAEAEATTLTNLDNTISGAGTISDSNLTLINAAAGVIDANQSLTLAISTGANTVVNAGLIEARGRGGGVVKSALDNIGLIFADGGNLTVGVVTGDGTARIRNATLEATSTFSQNVVFAGATGTLELARSRSFSGTITGFSHTGGTSLDLEDIAFVSGTTTATFSGTATSGILTVKSGGQIATIKLDGDYLASTFTVSSDGHGGTTVVDPTTASADAGASTQRFVAALAAFAPPAAIAEAPAPRQAPQPRLLAAPTTLWASPP